MIFMDIGKRKFKMTLGYFLFRYKYYLIAIFLIGTFFLVKDLVTKREVMVYDVYSNYLYTIDTHKGLSIMHAPDVEIPDGYTIVWYDNPEYEGTRIGFPYLVEDDGAIYPKLVGKYYAITLYPQNGEPSTMIVRKYNSPLTAPEDPVREGYFFAGWYESGSPTAFEFTVMPLDGADLYAKWIRIIDGS